MDDEIAAAKIELQALKEEAAKVRAEADASRRELASARGDHVTVRPPLCQGDFRAFVASFRISKRVCVQYTLVTK